MLLHLRIPPVQPTTLHVPPSPVPNAHTLTMCAPLPHKQVMAWMEQCCYISASRLRSPHILTASMDSLSFAASTRVGDIMYLTAQAGHSV